MSPIDPVLVLPASPWRRFASAIYDGLLLLGIWMGVTLIYVPIRDALGGDPRNSALPALLFLAGAGFFGWSWTHGGRTPGMLAWQLKVRRADGGALRWPTALGRYAAMLATWGLSLLPLLSVLPTRLFALVPHAPAVVAFSSLLAFLALLSARFDGRRRAPCDRFTDTEVIVLARTQRRQPDLKA